MRLQLPAPAAVLTGIFASLLASADPITVTNQSPAWVETGAAATTWVLPSSANVPSPDCGDLCEPVGLFQFSQTFANAPGFYTINASDVDTGASYADDKIYFYNGSGLGYVQFVSSQAPDFGPPGATDYGVLCTGPFSEGIDDCSGTAALTTTGGATISFTAESGIDVFGDGIPNVDDGISFSGVILTPEPSLAIPLGMIMVAGLAIGRARRIPN